MEVKKRVLIVDDETAICESLAGLIEDEGYSVLTASNVLDATAHSQDVDCIILDLQLSPNFEMEGGDVIKHVWDDIWCDIPVIIYSGFLGIKGISDDLRQIERVWGKGRNIFRLVPKSGGVKLLMEAVNDCLKRNMTVKL